MNYIFRSSLQAVQCSIQATRNAGKLVQFTDLFNKKAAEEKNQKVSTGRAWKAAELRFKSNEDLHKLWYVLLREKNALKSDNQYKFKVHEKIGPQGRLGKVKRTMARLLTIVNERKKIREEYRTHLEEEYLQKQREALQAVVRSEQEKNKLTGYIPELTQKVLRAKYRDLKRGIDNTDYIAQAAQIEQDKTKLQEELNSKFDYKNKKIVSEDSQVEDENTVIRQFSSGFLKQLEEGRVKIPQEEVLRSHVKNWKMLSMKQRRIVLNLINARRAKDAKQEFLKELNLFSQKVAFDNLQSRITKDVTRNVVAKMQ